MNAANGPNRPNRFWTPQPSDDPNGAEVARANYLSRWQAEAEFEEELRFMMKLVRPHRAERLAGWAEYRSRGEDFCVTVSWSPRLDRVGRHQPFRVPHMADVLESILVGSARDQDELDARTEFELYAGVVRELERRLKEMKSRYD